MDKNPAPRTDPNPWLAPLDACRSYDDRELTAGLGVQMTGGGCSALGVTFTHGGSTYDVLVTGESRGDDGILYGTMDHPEWTSESVSVGVYSADPDRYMLGHWAMAEMVRIDEVYTVVGALLARVHHHAETEGYYARAEWLALPYRIGDTPA